MIMPIMLIAQLATASLGPFTTTSQSSEPALDHSVVTPSRAVAKGLFFLYQHGIAPSKGQRCPMAPSCSEFGRIAFREHGLFKGLGLTVDRLNRCGHDLRYYPPIFISGAVRSGDPVP